jgi:hypothetical protein
MRAKGSELLTPRVLHVKHTAQGNLSQVNSGCGTLKHVNDVVRPKMKRFHCLSRIFIASRVSITRSTENHFAMLRAASYKNLSLL